MVNYRANDEVTLTGDALFVDSVGFTELEFGEEEAEMEYETLHDTLMEEPDDITVLLGHVTITNDGHYENGSPGQPVAALLEEVRDRLDLVDLDRDEFVEQMVENIRRSPATARRSSKSIQGERSIRQTEKPHSSRRAQTIARRRS